MMLIAAPLALRYAMFACQRAVNKRDAKIALALATVQCVLVTIGLLVALVDLAIAAGAR